MRGTYLSPGIIEPTTSRFNGQINQPSFNFLEDLTKILLDYCIQLESSSQKKDMLWDFQKRVIQINEDFSKIGNEVPDYIQIELKNELSSMLEQKRMESRSPVRNQYQASFENDAVNYYGRQNESFSKSPIRVTRSPEIVRRLPADRRAHYYSDYKPGQYRRQYY